MMDSDIQTIVAKLGLSLLIGLLIGAEREYRNKSAGLRTMILICLGSTIFTMISLHNSHESEIGRIASNIVTGIGFLGAGAIMRDGLSVSGLTTASTIWVVAALGMAIGFGEFIMAITGTGISLVVLIVFNYFQRAFDSLHKTIDLKVVFDIEQNSIDEMEERMKQLKIRFDRKKEGRSEGDVRYEYEMTGRAKNIQQLIDYLITQKHKVKSFEY
jgi:putative Mg2+ transporter-C (MgtC) family protein